MIAHPGVRRSLSASVAVAVALLVAAASARAAAEERLYVANGGSHSLVTFNVHKSGALTPFGPPVSVDEPRGVTVGPDGRTLYAASTLAFDEANPELPPTGFVRVFSIRSNGKLDFLQQVETGGLVPFGIAIAPNGESVYVSNSFTNDVSVFGVFADGRLEPMQRVSVGNAHARGLAVTPDGRFVFVSRQSENAPVPLSGFEVQSDGTLEPLSAPMPLCARGFGIATAPRGGLLYVACSETDTVSGYRVGSDGSLRELAGSPYPVGDFPEGIAITPDSEHLYVTNVGSVRPGQPGLVSDSVSSFAIGADGSLEPNADQPSFVSGLGPSGITALPDGERLVVAGFDSNDVSVFSIGALGLTDLLGTFSSRGLTPAFQGVATRPNQGPTAAFSSHVGHVDGSSEFDASGSSDEDGDVVSYRWDFGDGTLVETPDRKVSHVYEKTGRFLVTLLVTDDKGCSDTQVYTGQKALCNGTSVARSQSTIDVDG